MRASAREALGWVFTQTSSHVDFPHFFCSQAFSKMPNSIIKEEYVRQGLLKMHKLWLTLLPVAAVSLVYMYLLVLNDR